MAENGRALGSSPAGSTDRGNPVRRILRLWRDGAPPDVALFLVPEDGLGPHDRLRVLLADQRSRWRNGHPLPAEWYFERFPDVAADPELALDLIHGEFLLQEEAGNPPRLDDFLAR